MLLSRRTMPPRGLPRQSILNKSTTVPGTYYMSTNCVYWLKRDFRLIDNPALTAALGEHDRVFPLFIFEPSARAAPETSALHLHAQADAYNGLARAIHEAGGQLALATEEVVPLLGRLHAAKPITHLVSHQETGVSRTYARDLAVADWCAAHGVVWTEHLQAAVFRGSVDRDKRHADWNAFMDTPALPVPAGLERLRIPEEYRPRLAHDGPLPASIAPVAPPRDKWVPDPTLLGEKEPGEWSAARLGIPLTDAQHHYVQPVNERAAGVTLRSFMRERAVNYSKGMSSPNTAFYHCSRLSVHFAWGTMTVRTAYQTVKAEVERLKEVGDAPAKTMARNLRSFLSRLHWHDHFTQRLETEVEMEHRPLNPNFYTLKLANDPVLLEAWLTGATGYPMVDACIRCMATTGYINFRMRAMLTSVAAHMLHLDFRSIDKPMARLYTDYEPGIHLAQLQMQSGMVGINTLRTYSPEKQFLDHDPEAEFVHRWVSELRDFTAKEIAKRDLTEGLGTYPPAVVDRTPQVKAYKQLVNDLKYAEGAEAINQAVFAKHGSRKGSRRKPTRKTKA